MISEQKIIELNEAILQEEGTVLNEAEIGSALSSYSYYETQEEQACSILRGLVKNHPFRDGNKRTGAGAFILVCEELGLTPPSDTELASFTLKVAEDKMKIGEIVKMIFGDYKKESEYKLGMIKQASKLLNETDIEDYNIKQAKKLIAQLNKKADWYYDVSQHAVCQNIIRLLSPYTHLYKVREALQLFLEVIKQEIIA